MKLRACFAGVVGLTATAVALAFAGAQEPPMVEKHIFSPDTEIAESPKKGASPKANKLEGKITFTGVIISPQGKRAIIKQKGEYRKEGNDRSSLYKEGDEIDGMTLKEIGGNFVVLLDEGKEVRIKLYTGDKRRPVPPSQPKVRKAPPPKPRAPKWVKPPSAVTKRRVSRPILGKRPTQSPSFPKGSK